MQTAQSVRDVIERLQKILGEEKRFLLAGDYSRLVEIAQEKEQLATTLDRLFLEQTNASQAPAFRKSIAAIVSLAQENEQLLHAAKTGVSFAQARLKEIINRQRNVGVYNETGEKPLIPGATATRGKFA